MPHCAHSQWHTTSLLLQIYDEVNRNLASRMATFTTAPDASGASKDSLRILAAADVGTLQDSYGWQYPREHCRACGVAPCHSTQSTPRLPQCPPAPASIC